jgi:hypothetical protein
VRRTEGREGERGERKKHRYKEGTREKMKDR